MHQKKNKSENNKTIESEQRYTARGSAGGTLDGWRKRAREQESKRQSASQRKRGRHLGRVDNPARNPVGMDCAESRGDLDDVRPQQRLGDHRLVAKEVPCQQRLGQRVVIVPAEKRKKVV